MTLSLLGAGPGAKKSGSGGTFTINPGSQSGGIVSSNAGPGADYAVARDGQDVLNAGPGTSFSVGQEYFPGDTYSADSYACFQAFLVFDLAAVTGTTCTAAALSLGLSNDQSDDDFQLMAFLHDWGPTLTTADFLDIDGLQDLVSPLATLASDGIGSTGAYKLVSESGTALRTAVTSALGSTLRMVLVSDQQIGSASPTARQYLAFEAFSDLTLKPKLVVTTT